jgi:hypothetical protein
MNPPLALIDGRTLRQRRSSSLYYDLYHLTWIVVDLKRAWRAMAGPTRKATRMPIRSRPYEDDDLPALQSALAGWIQEAGTCGYVG